MSTTKTAALVRAPKLGANQFSINLVDENSDSLPTALGIKPERAKAISDDTQKMMSDPQNSRISTLLHNLGETYTNPNERAFAVYSVGNLHGMQEGGMGDLMQKLMGTDKGGDMPGWSADDSDDDESSEEAGV